MLDAAVRYVIIAVSTTYDCTLECLAVKLL